MEEVIRASCTIDEDGQVFTLWAEPTPDHWMADPVDGDAEIAVLVEMDESYTRETGRVAGVEIIGFADFSKWDSLPELPGTLWQYSDWEPLPFRQLFRMIHERVKGSVHRE